MNPKDLKLGDEVWVAGIVFGKTHKKCCLNMRPTKGFVTKIQPDPWRKGLASVYITDGSTNIKQKNNLCC